MDTHKNYSVGLDIGTSSIGFAAIDEDYNPVRMKGKTVVGARLFTEGKTAAERRLFRTTRRRLKRRKWRLRLLEEFFDPYMSKVDSTFFARLKESNLSPRDKAKHFKGSLLFPQQTDSAFYDKYPTIYHLRNALMKEQRKFDLREVYLAIHHIVKYRGNFLNGAPVSQFSTEKIDFVDAFNSINEAYDEFSMEEFCRIALDNLDEISQIIFDEKQSKFDKQRSLAKIIVNKTGDKKTDKIIKRFATNISKALLGYKFDLTIVLGIDDLDTKKANIQLSDENIDDTLQSLSTELDSQRFSILTILSKLYSQINLTDVVPNGMTLSESMIQKYNDHRDHLKMLKRFAKTLDRKKYKKVMEAYGNYVGNESTVKKVLTQDEFYKAIKRLLDDSVLATEIKKLIDNKQFMPKQRSSQNGVIPYQLNLKELNRIIEMQGKYYPWLAEINPNKKRISKAKYKLSELVAFRIPYYVGPLITKEDQQASSNANFAWMIRKESGQITPWNFDQKVDLMASANSFIRRMTTKDTYLLGEDVLPLHSLLYERFTVLNELNMVRVNGHRLSVGQKQLAYDELFKKYKTVKAEQLANLLVAHGMPDKPNIQGLSNPDRFNSSLSTYLDFVKIFGRGIDNPNRQNDYEKIIEWITIFEDKAILQRKLQTVKWLSSQNIDELSAKHYSGWGRLSSKLLAKLTDKDGKSIIDKMWDSQKTFMEIVTLPIFAEQIKNANQGMMNSQDYEAVLDDAYTSPQNKKAIRQVVKVVDDIVRAAGHAPKFISLEFAREDQKSHRTSSRLNQLKKVYETTAKELVENDKVREELGDCKDLTDRLFLYFTQLGRDMYTGDEINIDEISTNYDIDHILPQAFIKDDSLDNRVLVSRAVNNGKSNNVPLLMYGQKMKSFWKELMDHQLISKRKYNNLFTNPKSLGKYTANGFIKRQLVETRQVIKLAANILANRYADEDTQIIEVKANLNHQLRKSLDLYKVRAVNDYHHGVDAYLTAFVGQYLYHRYSNLQSYFVYGKFQRFFDKSAKQNLKFNNFNFLYDLIDGSNNKIVDKATGEVVGNKNDLIRKIKRVYNYKFMLISHEVFTKSGALCDQTVYPASLDSKKKLIPIKQGKPTNVYGGRSRNFDAYMAIINIHKKKKDQIKLVGIPISSLNKLDVLERNNYDLYLDEIHRVINERIASSKKDRKTGKRYKVYFDFDVLVPKVMYSQLIIDGDLKYLLGSSACPYNGRQIVLSNRSMKTLANKAVNLNNVTDNDLSDVYDDILQIVNKYLPLYDKNHFRKSLNDGKGSFSSCSVDVKSQLIDKILIGLHDNAARASLTELGMKTPFGFMQLKSGIVMSPEAQLIYQSPTGLFERRLPLKKIMNKIMNK